MLLHRHSLLDLLSHPAEVAGLDPLDQVELKRLLLPDYLEILPLGLKFGRLLLNRALGRRGLLETDSVTADRAGFPTLRLAYFLQRLSSCLLQFLPLLHDFELLSLQLESLSLKFKFLLLVDELFLLPLLTSKLRPNLLLLLVNLD